MKTLARPALRSAATSISTMAGVRIRALTERHPIKPTSPRCHSAWQLNLGRHSTYRRGKSVQTTGTTSSGQSPYRQFMVACLAGKVEGRPVVTAHVAPAAQIPGKWESCEQLALQRGDSVSERRSAESGPSP